MTHDDLRALAKAAKRDALIPWSCNATTMTESGDGEEVGEAAVARTHEHDGSDEGLDDAARRAVADTEYIAAASPDVVIGLLDEIERLRACVRQAHNLYEMERHQCDLDEDVQGENFWEGHRDEAMRVLGELEPAFHVANRALGTATPSVDGKEPR